MIGCNNMELLSLERRKKEWQSFLAKGWPSKKLESWKYTSLKPLAESGFNFVSEDSLQPSHELLKKAKSHLMDNANALVFIDGLYNPTLSQGEDFHLKFVADEEASSLSPGSVDQLNFAAAKMKVVVEIPPHKNLNKPIHVLSLASQSKTAAAIRLEFHVAVGAQVSIVEEFLSTAVSAHSGYTKIVAAPGTQINYLRLQDDNEESYHLGKTDFQINGPSQVHSLTVHLGSRVARHELTVDINSAEAEVQVLGATVARGQQHIDNFTAIHHNVGGSTSQQLYKGILDGESKSIFRGLVRIEKQAQKAQSDQLNNNLLLSEKAEADSLPQLEIFADDVKATHGSTVGELNEEEIFYFQSRAIAKDKAIALLSAGFVQEVVFKLSDAALREWAQRRINEKLQSVKGLQV